ncbi:hypothetical protein F5Y16DRAFT_398663 [Xylariaceae sp. FL0255]|nr:hypothetical protein F5Y16DRAFT_398663 [Xylariaceae sp. FL0255]
MIPSLAIQATGSRQSSGRQTSGLTTSKLRDSCHACAVSKIKCLKQKPTCSRCAKRDIPCEYIATKRPGRKPERERKQFASNKDGKDNPSVVSSSSQLQQGEQYVNTGSTIQVATPSSEGLTFMDMSTAPASAISSSLGSGTSSAEEPITPQDLGALQDPLGDFLNMPIDIGDVNSLASFLLELENHEITASFEVTDFMSVTASADLFSTSSGNTFPAMLSSGYSQEPRKLEKDRPDVKDPACSCLMQALDMMKKLFWSGTSDFPRGETSPWAINGSDSLNEFLDQSSISPQDVVTENKQATEAMILILDCPCSKGSYQLVMLAMIMLKMMGKYASTLYNPTSKGPGGLPTDNHHAAKGLAGKSATYHLDAGTARRMTTQLILSELHRIQGLVNRLSSKIRDQSERSSVQGEEKPGLEHDDGNQPASFFGISNSVVASTMFSVNTMKQIETDLRQALNHLSSELIGILRNS